MTFKDVLDIIERDLVGKSLSSIRPGAELVITSVDRKNRRLEILTSSGEKRPRSLIELERIWNELCSQPAVHVDSFLGGSGSSRNQPETILANLPFVEWFMFKRKKHIACVGAKTHEPATVQKMDSLSVAELIERLTRSTEMPPLTCVIVSESLSADATELERLAGVPVRGIGHGIYEQVLPDRRQWLVGEDVTDPGTYAVVTHHTAPPRASRVTIGDETFFLVKKGAIQQLIRVE